MAKEQPALIEKQPQKQQQPHWLEWIKQVHAVAQWGLMYSKDPFEIERYEVLKKLSIDMMADYTEMDTEKIKDLFAHEIGYVTPKVDVRGVVFKGNKLLMIKEKRDGCWTIPGGWADVGLSPSESVIKEVWEESGFEVRAVKLIGVIDKKFHNHPPSPYHIYKLFILCEITGGEATTSNESTDVAFYGEDEIPPLSQHRLTPTQVEMIFKHLKDPNRPTDFD